MIYKDALHYNDELKAECALVLEMIKMSQNNGDLSAYNLLIDEMNILIQILDHMKDLIKNMEDTINA